MRRIKSLTLNVENPAHGPGWTIKVTADGKGGASLSLRDHTGRQMGLEESYWGRANQQKTFATAARVAGWIFGIASKPTPEWKGLTTEPMPKCTGSEIWDLSRLIELGYEKDGRWGP